MPYKDPIKQKQAQHQHYVDNKLLYLSRAKNRKISSRKFVQEYKKTKKCEKCGESHFACLDFHHKNKDEKTDTIANMISYRRFSIPKILEEIQKCQVLCANCHRKLHYEERHRAT